jgi:hypothetical protein
MVINALTFELRIFLRKKRNRIEQLKKGVKRVLRFCVPAQEARSGQPLAPILGQVQINTFDFCTNFNNKTKDYPKGLLMFVELIVNWDKTYDIKLNSFPLMFLISEYVYTPLDTNNAYFYYISFVDFFKLTVAYQLVTGILDLEPCVCSLFHCLNTYKIKIVKQTEIELIQILKYMFKLQCDKFLILEQNVKGFGTYNKHITESKTLLKRNFKN